MKPEAQRIAIAQACGYKKSLISDYGPYPYWDAPNGDYLGGGSWFPVPDFCNDLNAMHEAEKVLTDAQSCTYFCALCDLKSDRGPNASMYWHVYHATAAQRAEAFLRAIGKWQEEAP